MLLLADKLWHLENDLDLEENAEIGYSEDLNDTVLCIIEESMGARLIDRFESYEIETGASKAVIIPKNYGYVIKIPFNGQYSLSFDADEDYAWDYFCNADNIANNWDYCRREVEMYEEAESCHMEKHFARTFYWTCTDGYYPLYLQEKCRCEPAEKPSQNSIRAAAKMDDDDNIIHSITWVAAFIDFYGIEAYKTFKKWITDDMYGLINDLRESNLGYRCTDGAPVVIDYSGFWD